MPLIGKARCLSKGDFFEEEPALPPSEKEDKLLPKEPRATPLTSPLSLITAELPTPILLATLEKRRQKVRIFFERSGAAKKTEWELVPFDYPEPSLDSSLTKIVVLLYKSETFARQKFLTFTQNKFFPITEDLVSFEIKSVKSWFESTRLDSSDPRNVSFQFNQKHYDSFRVDIAHDKETFSLFWYEKVKKKL